MSVQDSKSSSSDPLGGVLLTTFVVGLAIGGGLVFGFRVGQEDYWKYRAQNAESQIENAQRRAESAEAKYTALITGAAIK